MLTDVLKRSFFRFLLALAPVNKEPLAVFAQVFHLSESHFLLDEVKKDFFQIFACLSACEQDAFEGFC